MSDRREFINQLLGGTVAGIPAVKSVESLSLGKKDVIVLTVKDCDMTNELRARLTETMKREFPDNKVLVMSDTIDLSVIREK